MEFVCPSVFLFLAFLMEVFEVHCSHEGGKKKQGSSCFEVSALYGPLYISIYIFVYIFLVVNSESGVCPFSAPCLAIYLNC